MTLREQLIMRDGKARPPAILRKVCMHNARELDARFRGDIGFDSDFYLGREEEVYTCIQCGYSVTSARIMHLYQQYALDGSPIIIGRVWDKING